MRTICVSTAYHMRTMHTAYQLRTTCLSSRHGVTNAYHLRTYCKPHYTSLRTMCVETDYHAEHSNFNSCVPFVYLLRTYFVRTKYTYCIPFAYQYVQPMRTTCVSTAYHIIPCVTQYRLLVRATCVSCIQRIVIRIMRSKTSFIRHVGYFIFVLLLFAVARRVLWGWSMARLIGGTLIGGTCPNRNPSPIARGSEEEEASESAKEDNFRLSQSS
jgi:hypothetical protein